VIDYEPGHIELTEAQVAAGVKRVSIEAVITRANGTVEDLGTVCESGPADADVETPV
jgi:hypothetical protein